jgi:YD repeat-containing protein
LLRFEGAYNSLPLTRWVQGFFQNWTHTYQRRLLGYSSTSQPWQIEAVRDDGKVITFLQQGTSYNYTSDPDISDQLIQLNAGTSSPEWEYIVAADDSVEYYDNGGVLMSVTRRDGRGVTMVSSTTSTPGNIAPGPDYLLSVTDNFGRAISLTYGTTSQSVNVTDPKGQSYVYLANPYGLLASLTFPDSTIIQYLYNESAYAPTTPQALLTGIIDENDSRFATLSYGSTGLATKEQLNGGNGTYVGTYAVTYSTDSNNNVQSATVVDPLNTSRSYGTTPIYYVSRLNALTQPNESGGNATASTAYDANGNLSSQIDFNGNLTCYVFDLTRNLQTGRVEGMAPGSTCPANIATYTTTANTVQRKVLTQNHPIWHLPAVVAEPLKITTYVYNGDNGAYCAPSTAMVGTNHIGVLCSKSEQATTDPTGSAGFGATPLPGSTARVWSYTYNQYGQVLTATDPLSHTTTSVYYPSTDTAHSPPWYQMGDLETVTDPLGHVTTYTQYDGNGRLLSMTDPNGVITTMTYKARGWLATKTVTQPSGGAETTTYGYDNVGELTQVTLPDSTYIKYAYDPAHRLTTITDSAGDSINYTLDAMGNRTDEKTEDPTNTLTRNVARVYDALSRLSQVTGAMQ